MYAVIKTGGKQYRVQPGDLLVVEKLEGDVGAEIAFNEILMLGDDGATHLGAPLIDGGIVRATLVETRKGDKVRTVKKIRRQGHRRTKGHRQFETVLRVTGLEGAGLSAKWDGEVDLTPLSTLRLRARSLAPRVEAEEQKPAPKTAAKKAPKVSAKDEADAGVVDEQAAAAAAPEAAIVDATTETPKAAKKASPAKKAAPEGVVDEQEAAAEAKPKKTAAKKKASPDASGDEAASETE